MENDRKRASRNPSCHVEPQDVSVSQMAHIGSGRGTWVFLGLACLFLDLLFCFAFCMFASVRDDGCTSFLKHNFKF